MGRVMFPVYYYIDGEPRGDIVKRIASTLANRNDMVRDCA